MEFASPNSDRLPPEGCARWAEFAGGHRLPEPVRFAVDHALAEHLQNIVNYSGATNVTVRFELKPGAVVATVRDDGAEFDPTQVPEVDTKQSLADRPIGGLGIHMMRRLCDGLSYRRLAGVNQLELTKKLGAA